MWKKLEDILVFFGISSSSTVLNKTEEENVTADADYFNNVLLYSTTEIVKLPKEISTTTLEEGNDASQESSINNLSVNEIQKANLINKNKVYSSSLAPESFLTIKTKEFHENLTSENFKSTSAISKSITTTVENNNKSRDDILGIDSIGNILNLYNITEEELSSNNKTISITNNTILLKKEIYNNTSILSITNTKAHGSTTFINNDNTNNDGLIDSGLERINNNIDDSLNGNLNFTFLYLCVYVL